MIIKSLELKNYRNYDELSMNFASGTNLLYGDNAQGKTNILESIYLSATTKSHRGNKDRELIKFEENEAHIRIHFEKQGIDHQLDMHLKKNKAKGVAIDRIPIRRSSDLLGQIPVILFSPEDLKYRAVRATDGLLLTSGGLPIEVLYHACSGGKTEDAAAVFASAKPYLVSVDSPGEEGYAGFRADTSFSCEEAADLLLRAFPGCGVTADTLPSAIRLQSTTASGRVATLLVGSQTVRGADFRKALSLRSTYFTWEADGDRIVFHTVGYGHGVGLSQAGAQAMAADGADFAEILAHYYPGTQLTRMDKTGFSGS